MPHRTQPLSTRLSWDEAHRLEVLMRRRAHGISRTKGDACAACGAPLAGDGVRVAGVLLHPACLPTTVVG